MTQHLRRLKQRAPFPLLLTLTGLGLVAVGYRTLHTGSLPMIVGSVILLAVYLGMRAQRLIDKTAGEPEE